MSLELDFEILCDDYDRLVALESIGVRPDNAAVLSIRKRWCLSMDDEPFVGTESSAMMERAQAVHDAQSQGSLARVYGGKAARLAGKGATAVGRAGNKQLMKGVNAAGRASHQLAMRFVGFADELAKDTTKKIAHVTSKATILEKQLNKLEGELKDADELKKGTVEAGAWTSKVCFEDKVSIDKTIEFTGHSKVIEARIDEFTVQVRSIFKGKKVDEHGVLERMGRSTDWAVKRASKLIGIVSPTKEVKATCFGGNVVVVERDNGLITYAVAKDGDYGHTLPSLSKSDCERALKGVRQAVTTLRELGVKRKLTGYTAVDEEAETLKADLKNVALKDLRRVTGYYKTSMALNDAFVTALVRSAEGLLEYVRQSIKEGA